MVQSLEKAITLLNAVARCKEPVGVRELARICGISPSTAHPLLKTLEAARYLDFDEGSRRYRLGFALLSLSNGMNPLKRMAELIKPHVDALSCMFNETALAITYDYGIYRAVYYRQSSRPLATSVPLDVMDLPHFSACGLALLAWQGDDALKAYLKMHAGKHPGLERLAPESIARIRKDGHCVLKNFLGSAAAAYGVPVFGVNGQPLMSLGFSLPMERFSSDMDAVYLEKVKNTAKLIEHDLAVRSLGLQLQAERFAAAAS